MLKPESREVVTGHVEIRQVFRSSSHGNIAGCYVLDGEVQRGSLARILRDSTIVYQGRVGTLRREKDDARTVASGYECGIKLESFEDIKAGDIIETFRVESVAKTLA
jgi:translation initiation factor IF-2